MKNTKQQGQLRFLVYKTYIKDVGDKYIGVCLELDERVFEDNLQQALKHIIQVAEGVIETAVRENLSDRVLNQRAPLRYYFRWYFGGLIAPFLKEKEICSIQTPLENVAYGMPLS